MGIFKIFEIYFVRNVGVDMEEAPMAGMCKNLVDLTIVQTKSAVEIP